VVKIGMFRKIAETAARIDVARGASEQFGTARGRKQQLQQQLQCGGLAGAVRAEQAEDLAALDVHRERVERVTGTRAPEPGAEVFRQPVGTDQFFASSSSIAVRNQSGGMSWPAIRTPLMK